LKFHVICVSDLWSFSNRFVRFVSTPEVLERVSTIEMELIEVAEAIRAQANIASELARTV
jgi:hypothetical protein